MEVNRREVPLYVSAYVSCSKCLMCWWSSRICFGCGWVNSEEQSPIFRPDSKLFFLTGIRALQSFPPAFPLLSLTPDSPSVQWLTGKPCVAGETQARRVSVPGEARPYTACSPKDKALWKHGFHSELGGQNERLYNIVSRLFIIRSIPVYGLNKYTFFFWKSAGCAGVLELLFFLTL